MTIKFKPIFIIVFCVFNLNYAKSQSKELTSVFLEKLTWTEGDRKAKLVKTTFFNP